MSLAQREIEARLASLGARPDETIDLADAALLLAAHDRPQKNLAPYREHLGEIARLAGKGEQARSMDQRLARINHVLYEVFGYAGDAETYEDPDNADLMRVIDRRRGLPVALGILYIHAARAQGWPASGLAFPGHFLVRLEDGAARAIVDPFHAGHRHDAGSLRDLVKQFLGADAELSPGHYAAASDRAVLLRLQNNIKARALQRGDLARAAQVLRRMSHLAPDAADVWRELGLVRAQEGNIVSAIEALQRFLDRAPEGPERERTLTLLTKLKSSLN